LFNVNGTVTIYNSTIAGNTADDGGGVYNLAHNASQGITVTNASLTLQNTILASSTAANDLAGSTFGSGAGTQTINASSSIVETGEAAINGTNSNTITADPRLGTLANNGGPTETMALLSGSPAIDAGGNAICSAAPVNNLDQRGVTRPQPNGGACDIGAYELLVPVTAIPALSLKGLALLGLLLAAAGVELGRRQLER